MTTNNSKTSVPQIENGKTPEALTNVTLLYPLPVDTPFGNLQRIPPYIIERLDQINLKLREIFKIHEEIQAENLRQLSKYRMLIDEVVFWLSVTADDLIMLVSLLDKKLETGAYPKKIPIQDMGGLLSKPLTNNLKQLFESHEKDLRSLNDSYNSLKHHLIKYDNDLIGVDQPRFICLYNRQNSADTGTKPIEINVSEIVGIFNAFYSTATGILKSLGQEIKSI